MNVRVFILILFFGFLNYSCKKMNNNLSAGFLVHTLQDERWSIERDVFTKKINEMGGEVKFENANQDERVQYHQAKQLIDEGIDVLVIVPVNSKTAASIARLCKKNKVKIIAYDIMIDNCDLDLYISFDNMMIGELMAEYAVAKKPSGNYVLLWGDSNMKVAQWIKEGQLKVLEPYVESGQIDILYRTYVAGWSKDNSSHLLNRVIDFSDSPIDAVLASSDGIAEGAITGFTNAGITDFPLITGQDASQTALQFIREGKQSMSIYKQFEKLADIAALAAYDLVEGKEIKADTILYNGRSNIPSILLQPFIIDLANIGDR